jgi:hypothetical protein
MVAARIIPAIMTNAAPEKRAIRGIFRFMLMLTVQRRGSGIERRYISVTTLRVTVRIT